MVELLFEKHALPAVFLAKNPVLTSFASGRATALVVDCGGGGTSVTAVHDGYALKQASARSPLGGDAITDIVLKYLEKKKACPIRPRHEFTRRLNKDGETFDVSAVKRPNISSSYRLFKQREIAADVKETTCRLSDRAYDEAEMKNVPTVAYELPDGNVVDVGAERFKIPELLFRPELLAELDLGADAPELKTPDGGDAKGLPALILDVINSCDVDVRKDLFGGMLLAGGGVDVRAAAREARGGAARRRAHNVRVNMTPSANAVERKFRPWIGGSIPRLPPLVSTNVEGASRSTRNHGAQLVDNNWP
jgi:Actin and related proteins